MCYVYLSFQIYQRIKYVAIILIQTRDTWRSLNESQSRTRLKWPLTCRSGTVGRRQRRSKERDSGTPCFCARLLTFVEGKAEKNDRWWILGEAGRLNSNALGDRRTRKGHRNLVTLESCPEDSWVCGIIGGVWWMDPVGRPPMKCEAGCVGLGWAG